MNYMTDMTDAKKWYAVYTKTKCENKVAQVLGRKGIEHFCPFNKTMKQWSERKKMVLEPLFASYVFIKIFPEEQSAIRKTEGILNFVYWLNKPAIIKSEEIEVIRQFLNEYSSVRLEKIAVNANDMVRVVGGPIIRQEGKVVSIRNKSVKVVLPSLGYLMYVELEETSAEIIHGNNIQRIGQLAQ